MTAGDSQPFRIIETSISGGRGNYNQRQVDETDLFIRENYSADYTKVGVIAPYRMHADMLRKQLPNGIEADTIHKFQGREKDAIIFNTVKNQIGEFIDNPNLINVAVSRAVKEFIVVKPAAMELPHGTNIGDMIRYICYTTDPDEAVVKGSICSVFDLLLYNRIDKSPILAIEVDGVSFHDNEQQRERDHKKNHILEILGLPLLRLSTDGHSEESKIIESLTKAMGGTRYMG